MFGELVTAYLFLAGVGAGGVAAASVADLLFVREPFGADVVPDFAEKRPAERLVAGVLALSCGALALGAGCLAADLGRADRVLSLFLAPPVTLMNLGAWAVALLTAVAVKPGSTRLTRSLVMIPALSVSKQACSNASPKAVRSVRPSRRPRFFKAPDQAKMVAMGLVEVVSPLR